jgi:hypothetical protein
MARSWYLTLLSEMLVRAGRHDEAARALEEADHLVKVNEERFCAGKMAELRAGIAAEQDQ